MALDIKSHEKSPRVFEIQLAGNLDTQTHAQLESHVAMLLESKPRALAFDMAKLDYISSMGLRVVMQAMKSMKAAGGEIVLANLQPHVKKVFDIAKVMPPGSMFSSVKEADDYFDAMQKKVKEESGQ